MQLPRCSMHPMGHLSCLQPATTCCTCYACQQDRHAGVLLVSLQDRLHNRHAASKVQHASCRECLVSCCRQQHGHYKTQCLWIGKHRRHHALHCSAWCTYFLAFAFSFSMVPAGAKCWKISAWRNRNCSLFCVRAACNTAIQRFAVGIAWRLVPSHVAIDTARHCCCLE